MNDAIARTDKMMASLGLEVYRVGGSVRDEIMGRPAKDADYMVRGVSLLGLTSVLHGNGLKHKPLIDRNGYALGVRLAKGGVEITLPRREVSTGPGRTDFEIVLDPDLGIADDARRRDFTFNALYKHLGSGEIGDPTSAGLHDIQHKLVRTTHSDSFRDDPLRILRALRFVATLGYDLSLNAVVQMRYHADAVDGLKDSGHLSGTVPDEFNRMLMGADVVKALRIARDTGVLARVFPELAPMIGFDQGSRYHDLTTDEHTFKALETAAHVDAPLRVRWALLFHDSGKAAVDPETGLAVQWFDSGTPPRAHYYAKDGTVDHEVMSERLWREAAGRMNVPRELREDVARLIRNHMVACSSKTKPSKVRRMRVEFGDAFLRDLFLHRACDLTGKGKANKEHMHNIGRAEQTRQDAQDAGVPRQIKDLKISGNDAANMGMNGTQIGVALRAVLDEVVVDPRPLKLTREWQLERLAGGGAA